jgi:glycosyltransferase involved in cell wall biosynthesis
MMLRTPSDLARHRLLPLKMKVLFICPNSPFESIGGIERYVVNLINNFKIRDDVETFLVLRTTGKSHVEKDGNMTIYYDNNLACPRKWKSAKEIADKSQGFSDIVQHIITTRKIDVICAENIIFSSPAAYSLKLNMVAAHNKIPLILRLHMYPESPLQIALTNELMWDHVSCVSKSVAADCFQKGTDLNKLSTEYLGVNIKDFNPKKDPGFNLRKQLGFSKNTRIILTAGRIITGTKNMLKEKGMINLIEAFSRISPSNPDLRLVIGVAKATKNLKEEFEASLEMLKGYIKINMVQEKTVVKLFELDQMPNVYRSSDVLVLPAEKNETLGQIFLEAMACGLPVIGAKTGGMPEIISDGISGYLVHPNDPIILAQRIESILDNSEIRVKFIENGHKTIAEKFMSENQFSDFHKLLKSIVV